MQFDIRAVQRHVGLRADQRCAQQPICTAACSNIVTPLYDAAPCAQQFIMPLTLLAHNACRHLFEVSRHDAAIKLLTCAVCVHGTTKNNDDYRQGRVQFIVRAVQRQLVQRTVPQLLPWADDAANRVHECNMQAA